MPTSHPIAYWTGTTIPEAYKVGNLMIGTATTFDYGFYNITNANGIRFWMSPDEDLGYVIGQSLTASTQTTPVIPATAQIGFYRTNAFTSSAFASLANLVTRVNDTPQNFTLGSQASAWLTANGYWNTYSGVATFTQVVFSSTTGAQSYTVPAGVTTISGLTVGGGGGGAGSDGTQNEGHGGGGGGALSYGTFTVSGGTILSLNVGAAGAAGAAGGNDGGNGGASTIIISGTTHLSAGGGSGGLERSTAGGAGGVSGGVSRTAGGNGGTGGAATGNDTGGGGGGAGGYSANGGNGGGIGAGVSSTGGGGGGGGATNAGQGYGGGGVGIDLNNLFTGGANGTGGALNAIGTGGSGGANGTRPTGGRFGGGGGACDDDTNGAGGAGGQGIIVIQFYQEA